MPAPAAYFHRATPPGEGGIAVFELYGPGAEALLRALFRPRRGALPSGRAALGEVLDERGEMLDEAMVARVPATGMWSGLEAWMVSIHGGPWLARRLEERLEGLGSRALDRRGVLRLALAAGALDAIQTCAYDLLLGARTERAARFFLRQYAGELSERLGAVLAAVERGARSEARRDVEELLLAARPAMALGRPPRVLIAGRPNAGKSTLFNRLVEEERAAVTPLAGTTRDLLEEVAAIDGFPIAVADSAGLRPRGSAGGVEEEGIRRVVERSRAGEFDLVLHLLPPPWRWTAEDHEFLAPLERERVLVVETMADLAGEGSAETAAGAPPAAPGATGAPARISAVTGAGLESLRVLLLERLLGAPAAPEVAVAPFTRAQAALLRAVREALGGGASAAALDAVRRLFIELLHSSWTPENET